MKMNSRALALAFLVFLAGADLAVAKHDEALTFKVPQGWKTGNESGDRRTQMQMIELIKDGDDIQNWKELLTEISAPKPHGVRKPADMLDQLKAQREKECPGSTVWNVIGEDENSITYEWQAKPCLGEPEQVEIAKIFLGKNTFFTVQYAKKVKELSAEERATWLKWFGDTTLTGAP
jgi:hypothetical protein